MTLSKLRASWRNRDQGKRDQGNRAQGKRDQGKRHAQDACLV